MVLDLSDSKASLENAIATSTGSSDVPIVFAAFGRPGKSYVARDAKPKAARRLALIVYDPVTNRWTEQQRSPGARGVRFRFISVYAIGSENFMFPRMERFCRSTRQPRGWPGRTSPRLIPPVLSRANGGHGDNALLMIGRCEHGSGQVPQIRRDPRASEHLGRNVSPETTVRRVSLRLAFQRLRETLLRRFAPKCKKSLLGGLVSSACARIRNSDDEASGEFDNTP